MSQRQSPYLGALITMGLPTFRRVVVGQLFCHHEVEFPTWRPPPSSQNVVTNVGKPNRSCYLSRPSIPVRHLQNSSRNDAAPFYGDSSIMETVRGNGTTLHGGAAGYRAGRHRIGNDGSSVAKRSLSTTRRLPELFLSFTACRRDHNELSVADREHGHFARSINTFAEDHRTRWLLWPHATRGGSNVPMTFNVALA